MTRKDIQSYLEDMGEEGAEDIVLYDGLESAFIGVETHEDPESETLMLRAI